MTTNNNMTAKKQNFTKANRAAIRQVDELNGIIHRRNLYVCLPTGNRRVINAHTKKNIDTGERLVFVQDLYDETALYGIVDVKLIDGYGQEVTI